jgi:hypothetical protein
MMDGGDPMPLVSNERWKLTANALNGVAVATMVTGFVAPLVAVSYGVSSMNGTVYFVVTGATWFLGGCQHTFGCESHSRRTQRMTFLEAYVMFGIPLILVAIAWAAVLWQRWEQRREQRRNTPAE